MNQRVSFKSLGITRDHRGPKTKTEEGIGNGWFDTAVRRARYNASLAQTRSGILLSVGTRRTKDNLGTPERERNGRGNRGRRRIDGEELTFGGSRVTAGADMALAV